ncbi:MAG: hypothetical protein ACTSVZ_10260 [Promethearchaeota archaeon]
MFSPQRELGNLNAGISPPTILNLSFMGITFANNLRHSRANYTFVSELKKSVDFEIKHKMKKACDKESRQKST